ncbi:hypothetical protein [Leminorella grimontii]|uniref:hypothetical protein n=1 Tax=Leminorella grimontii TaxID=82981 RepID=UPI0032206A9F
MAHRWWKDVLDSAQSWQGLELTIGVSERSDKTMEMVSGHRGRMSLWIGGEPLFWATVLEDHSGVWLVINEDHRVQSTLLPHVASADVEAAKRVDPAQRMAWWSRYFAERLADVESPLLSAGRWRLLPMYYCPPSSPYKFNPPQPVEEWHFKSPTLDSSHDFCWTLYGEDFSDLLNLECVSFVDWWWGGYLLRGRYAVRPDDGRLKWWRKKCREGSLPPVLVWYIAGIASYVILDGHCRLQAAIEEGVPPDFLMITEMSESVIPPDPEHQARIVKAIERQLEKPEKNVDSINKALIGLYNDRYSHGTTRSRAILGSGESWEREVREYLARHGLDDFLERILNRVE